MEEDLQRFVTSTKSDIDNEIETSLRPANLSEYVGQDKFKNSLSIYIEAAKKRKDALDHVLLFGPPGLGKTTLAHIIAEEMGVQIKVTSGPAIEKTADLAAILSNLEKNDILFIDEIHRLSHNIEEVLYPAMEDFALDFVVGTGPAAKNVRLPLQHFTLIGATTRAGMLTGPLRDRFGILGRLELYDPESLSKIISRSAHILKIDIDNEALLQIAKCSRGTPRIANRLLKRVRDYAQVVGSGSITGDVARQALKMMEIDNLGLDAVDHRLLLAIIDKFNGGPVGLDTLSASTGEESSTIEDVYEPYLMQLGFIARTSRGRVAMPLAYEHLGRSLDVEKRKDLENYAKQPNIE